MSAIEVKVPVCPICKKKQCSGAFGYPCDGLLAKVPGPRPGGGT